MTECLIYCCAEQSEALNAERRVYRTLKFFVVFMAGEPRNDELKNPPTESQGVDGGPNLGHVSNYPKRRFVQ
jgi:hypothetical protein